MDKKYEKNFCAKDLDYFYYKKTKERKREITHKVKFMKQFLTDQEFCNNTFQFNKAKYDI